MAGNHDITLDSDFYTEHGHLFHNQTPQSPASCLALLAASPSITYLGHESATIRLRSPTGPHTEFVVFGSPYSPRHGLWAFYYDAPAGPSASDDADLTALWELIPLQADIVVTHTPPRTHCDGTDERRATGCEALRRALWRVRPKLAVCGHMHDGRGVERVTWHLDRRDVAYAEKGVARWTDPGEGNRKLSLVDLTGKHGPALDNDGADPSRATDPPFLGLTRSTSSASQASCKTSGSSSTGILGGGVADIGSGPGGDALSGRMGRRETCVVNAAIMKSRYPHTGGKQFHKPIVVDVDLPVWEE